MKKILFLLFWVIFFSVSAHSVSAYFNPGRPSGFVNDYAGIISSAVKQQLEQTLINFKAESSNEISVVTINNLGGDSIENFAVKLFEEWGIGQKDKDNGVLILISKEDKEMRIEVGYGLEGVLTDAQSWWIIQNVMKPAFQKGDFDLGISNAVDKIITAIRGEYVPSQNKSTESSPLDVATFIFWALILFVPYLGAILGRSKSWWLGGVLGLVIGVILVFIFGWFVGISSVIILAPLGLLFDFLVSKNYQKRKKMGLRPSWWAGGTIGRSGGSGHGGFGGFGGGGSGGGGASGRW